MVLSPVRSPRSRSRSLVREQEAGPEEKARPRQKSAPKGQGRGGRKGETINVSDEEDSWGKWQGAGPSSSSAGRPKTPATGESGGPPAPPFMPC